MSILWSGSGINTCKLLCNSDKLLLYKFQSSSFSWAWVYTTLLLQIGIFHKTQDTLTLQRSQHQMQLTGCDFVMQALEEMVLWWILCFFQRESLMTKTLCCSKHHEKLPSFWQCFQPWYNVHCHVLLIIPYSCNSKFPLVVYSHTKHFFMFCSGTVCPTMEEAQLSGETSSINSGTSFFSMTNTDNELWDLVFGFICIDFAFSGSFRSFITTVFVSALPE